MYAGEIPTLVFQAVAVIMANTMFRRRMRETIAIHAATLPCQPEKRAHLLNALRIKGLERS
ncbi:hypothetical protein BU23DRAFT_553496 [Bimuria novae-zelandiae CBS 107.79]|uniref:Uncharacterized protein n=1 Tax=Bimuria novae-zelandiae CBS 107.79 TaxID=1447943 RepID=A0A6A5VHC6_9PLEO|nr:hypothetical protein BU23DRAFT_553496 [Bimuria novae-zelandiae CBS 107.79]